jgi:hypothetical protein
VQDELVTFASTSIGWQRDFKVVSGEGRGNFNLLARGFARMFLAEWSPNNHLANSAAVSSSVFLFGYGERSARLPALASYCIAVPLLVILAWILGRSTPLACLLGAVFLLHPYFFYYSMTSRGYAPAALLLLMQAAVLMISLRSSGIVAISLYAAQGLLMLLGFLNLVTMSWMWLPGFCIGKWIELARSRRSGSKVDHGSDPLGTSRAWWFWVCALIGLTCVLFVLLRLPQFLYAQNRYGEVVGNSSPWSIFSSILTTVAPNVYAAVLVLGILAAALLLVRRSWLGISLMTMLVTSVLYAMATGKIPYPRTWGPFYPMFLLAIAATWPCITQRYIRMTILAILGAATAWFAWQFPEKSPDFDPHYTDLACETREAWGQYPEPQTVIWMPWAWDVRFYLPAPGRYYTLPEGESGKVRMVFLAEMVGDKVMQRIAYWKPLLEKFRFWELPPELAAKRIAQAGKFVSVAADVWLTGLDTDTEPPDDFMFPCVETYSDQRLLEITARISEIDSQYERWRILPQKSGDQARKDDPERAMIAVFPGPDFSRKEAYQTATKVRQLLGGRIIAVRPLQAGETNQSPGNAGTPNP